MSKHRRNPGTFIRWSFHDRRTNVIFLAFSHWLLVVVTRSLFFFFFFFFFFLLLLLLLLLVMLMVFEKVFFLLTLELLQVRLRRRPLASEVAGVGFVYRWLSNLEAVSDFFGGWWAVFLTWTVCFKHGIPPKIAEFGNLLIVDDFPKWQTRWF